MNCLAPIYALNGLLGFLILRYNRDTIASKDVSQTQRSPHILRGSPGSRPGSHLRM